VWQNLILNGTGKPVAKLATVRPDTVHTSFTASIVWMDPRRMSFTLHPGTQVPGTKVDGQYTGATSLTGTALASTVASFNSGFMFKDADGGYWQDGQDVVPLVPGAASMVFGTDGSLSVQSWRGGQPGPGVQAVRQNLSLLINNGAVNPAVHDPTTAVWGKTVGNYAFVWRTGIGVRADGSIVFVIGPTLSIVTLTDLLQRAGAVNAMELDINKDWTSYLTYRGGSPTKLTPDEVPSAQRYLTSSTRDFVACSVRP
jgi:exopolysaccharide biosynthesis protein